MKFDREILVLLTNPPVIFNPFFFFSLHCSILPFKPHIRTLATMSFYPAIIAHISTRKEALFATAIAIDNLIILFFNINIIPFELEFYCSLVETFQDKVTQVYPMGKLLSHYCQFGMNKIFRILTMLSLAGME